jgi:hypothetical protein
MDASLQQYMGSIFMNYAPLIYMHTPVKGASSAWRPFLDVARTVLYRNRNLQGSSYVVVEIIRKAIPPLTLLMETHGAPNCDIHCCVPSKRPGF